MFAEGIHYLRPEGKYVVMGTISEGKTTLFDPAVLVRKSAQILGVNRYPPKYLFEALKFLEQNSQAFPFDKMIDRTFPLKDVATAIDLSAARKVQRAGIVP